MSLLFFACIPPLVL